MTQTTVEQPYLFGQGDLPALRLQKLANIFDPATRAFIASAEPPTTATAIDLGCGPGFTTAILASRFSSVVGLDVAADFLDAARTRCPRNATFVLHDAIEGPLPGSPAEVLFCRFLLTHMNDPARALRGWTAEVATGGMLACQEVNSIQTRSQPVLAYLELLDAVLSDRAQQLYIGPELASIAAGAGWGVRRNSVRVHRVDGRQAADMFALNLGVWGRAPEVSRHCSRSDLTRLADALERKAAGSGDAEDVVWGLRELILEKR